MRILSEVHDYYDSVQKSGQDATLLYVRRPRTVRYENSSRYPRPTTHKRWWFYHSDRLEVREHVIGFCGKVYGVLVLAKPLAEGHRTAPAICYTLDEVDRFIEASYKPKQVQAYYAETYKRNWRSLQRRTVFRTFFEECKAKQNAFSEIFTENRCPVFVAYRGDRECSITFNAPLKDFEFFRIFDTYTAFQEIAMFMGNLAVPLKPISAIPDKDMVEIKGFDKKWSFRKPPDEGYA